MNALRQASRDYPKQALEGFTLFASSEPCPMCVGAIALAGIRRVVFGAGATRAAEITGRPALAECRAVFALLGFSIEVVGPMLEEEALQLLG
jgi:tRNA(Arg) A34 adenosine deaminase TadA